MARTILDGRDGEAIKEIFNIILEEIDSLKKGTSHPPCGCKECDGRRMNLQGLYDEIGGERY